MSEDPPPPYISRSFVCTICSNAFEPSTKELQVLAAMEREFGLKADRAYAVCKECEGRRIQ